MIPPEEAWSRLEPHLEPLEEVEIPRQQAVGRALSRPLVSTLTVPSDDISAMDGFVLVDAPDPDEILPIVGTIAAGDPPGVSLHTGQAMRIMTGAPVPTGADRVVPVELTRTQGSGVCFPQGTRAGAHIRRRGEIQTKGSPLLPARSLITPGALSLLATHGYAKVPVHRPPTVTFLTTGDELVPPDASPGPGQIRDSHSDFLAAAGRSLGIEFRSLGISPDRKSDLHRKILKGLESDVLLLCGGVSMGEFDLVEDVLAELQCESLFTAVKVQPGKPLVAAIHPGGLVFGLPGNPASVMVSFWLFVRPALRRLMGLEDHFWHGALHAELAQPLTGAQDRDKFLPAEVSFRSGSILAHPWDPKGSHDLGAYSRGTALLRIPSSTAPRAAGDTCEILPLVDWPASVSDSPTAG